MVMSRLSVTVKDSWGVLNAEPAASVRKISKECDDSSMARFPGSSKQKSSR